jgi:hypothetical protein
MRRERCTVGFNTSAGSIVKHQNSESKKDSIPFWRVVLSVIQASFGVQSKDNRERDFKQGNMLPFVVAAVLFTVAFVAVLMIVVAVVLPD